MRTIALACAALALLAIACKDEAKPRVSFGTPLVKADSIEIYVDPTGRYVATLTDAMPSKETGAPQDIFLGSLMFAPVTGGSSHRIGREVPNLPGKVLYSKNGAFIACLADFSLAKNQGELRMASTATGDAESVADGVSYFSFSPSADTIAYVSHGDLFIRPTAGGTPKQLATSVSLIEFSPHVEGRGDRLLLKRTARSGGNLLLYETGTGKLTEIARGVGQFGFSSNGEAYAFQTQGLLIPGYLEATDGAPLVKSPKESDGFYRVIGSTPPRRLGKDGVTDFKFAPNSVRVAWTTPPYGGAPVGDLYWADSTGVSKVAARVKEFAFAPDETVYLIGSFDSRANAGSFGFQSPTGPLTQLARDVKQFTITPKGKYVLYSAGVLTSSSFTFALEAHRVGAPPDEKPRRIDTNVLGYVVDEQEERVAYKASCIESGKACNLYVTDLTQKTPPLLLAQRVAAFEFAPSPHGVIAVTSQHEGDLTGRLLYSLGVIATEPNAPFQMLEDQMSGEFELAGPARDHIVYVVNEKNRQGLYTTGLKPPQTTASVKP